MIARAARHSARLEGRSAGTSSGSHGGPVERSAICTPSDGNEVFESGQGLAHAGHSIGGGTYTMVVEKTVAARVLVVKVAAVREVARAAVTTAEGVTD